MSKGFRWFSLVDAVDATFDEGLASWASVGCGAGLYKRRKVKRVVTSKGWDRSSPRAGLAGLNTFAQLALGGVRSEGVGGGSVRIQVQVASRNRGRLGGRKRTGTRNVAQFRANVFCCLDCSLHWLVPPTMDARPRRHIIRASTETWRFEAKLTKHSSRLIPTCTW